MNRAKRPKAEIVEVLGRDRSSIYRELNRNTGRRGYRPKQAQRKAEERRLRCRREAKMENPDLKKHVKAALKKKWSRALCANTDEIAGRSKPDFPRKPDGQVSHQTIYNRLRGEAPELRVRKTASLMSATWTASAVFSQRNRLRCGSATAKWPERRTYWGARPRKSLGYKTPSEIIAKKMCRN